MGIDIGIVRNTRGFRCCLIGSPDDIQEELQCFFRFTIVHSSTPAKVTGGVRPSIKRAGSLSE